MSPEKEGKGEALWENRDEGPKTDEQKVSHQKRSRVVLSFTELWGATKSRERFGVEGE